MSDKEEIKIKASDIFLGCGVIFGLVIALAMFALHSIYGFVPMLISSGCSIIIMHRQDKAKEKIK